MNPKRESDAQLKTFLSLQLSLTLFQKENPPAKAKRLHAVGMTGFEHHSGNAFVSMIYSVLFFTSHLIGLTLKELVIFDTKIKNISIFQ